MVIVMCLCVRFLGELEWLGGGGAGGGGEGECRRVWGRGQRLF